MQTNSKLFIKCFSGPSIGLTASISCNATDSINSVVADVLQLLHVNRLCCDRTKLILKLRLTEDDGPFVDGLLFDGESTLACLMYMPGDTKPHEVNEWVAERFDMLSIYLALKSGEIACLFSGEILPGRVDANPPRSLFWAAQTGLRQLAHSA